jgi:hypothetical protein
LRRARAVTGAGYSSTGAAEQKQRSLDSNPQVAVTTGSTGANGWDSGEDIVVEGARRCE